MKKGSFWCQTGQSEYFRISWSTGILPHDYLSLDRYPISGSSLEENVLLRSEENSQKATVTQINTSYKVCRKAFLNTQHVQPSSGRWAHQVPLLSDKNRTLRLKLGWAHQNWTTAEKNSRKNLDFQFVLWHTDARENNMKEWIHHSSDQQFRLVL